MPFLPPARSREEEGGGGGANADVEDDAAMMMAIVVAAAAIGAETADSRRLDAMVGWILGVRCRSRVDFVCFVRLHS